MRHVALSVVSVLACHSRSGSAASEGCAPLTVTLPASASAENLDGTYRLKLVATSGAKTGASVEGTLRLRPQDGALQYGIGPLGARDSTTLHPLVGTLEVDLSSVDAVLVGSLMSEDPLQPGVLVIERHEKAGSTPTAEITMRLGSEANRRDRTRFDGGYTALRVQQVTSNGFAGTWGSGVTSERAGGYFCATRVG